ncbi:hypothetical protein [Streptococcus merionis]|uniref:hypothetical protein n=1 Tax=Streptococcus merionis TaxID=400065 RepID=UPI0035118509
MAQKQQLDSPQTGDNMYDVFMQTLVAASQLPFVKVDRQTFLRKQFKNDPHLKTILEKGPQKVYKPEALERKAKKIISEMTLQTSAASFVAGLPGGPAALAAGTADVVQFYGFALNLAQQIAYLYGEKELFNNGGKDLDEEVKIRIIAYLGGMFGIAGATPLIAKIAKDTGQAMGKRALAKPLTKTVWYPIIKQIGKSLGQRVTKQTVQKAANKIVPIIGGVLSGGLTYLTFKPLGENLSTVFVKNLRGEFDEMLTEADLNPKFLNQIISETTDTDLIEEAQFTEKH